MHLISRYSSLLCSSPGSDFLPCWLHHHASGKKAGAHSALHPDLTVSKGREGISVSCDSVLGARELFSEAHQHLIIVPSHFQSWITCSFLNQFWKVRRAGVTLICLPWNQDQLLELDMRTLFPELNGQGVNSFINQGFLYGWNRY